MTEEAKTGTTKLGAAVVGGYLLGRFKKGKLAMRLASQLSGQSPQQMLLAGGKQGADKVMSNAQAKEIVDQLRGPLMEAVQKVVMAQVNSRVSGLSSKLDAKTKELQSGGKQAIDTTADTAKGAGGKVKDKLTGKGKGDEQQNGEQPEQSDDDDLEIDLSDDQEPEEESEEEGSEESEEPEEKDEPKPQVKRRG